MVRACRFSPDRCGYKESCFCCCFSASELVSMVVHQKVFGNDQTNEGKGQLFVHWFMVLFANRVVRS